MRFQSVSSLQSPTNCITITCQLDEITWINASYHMLIEMRTRERLQVITCFEYGGIVMKNKCRLKMSMIKRVFEYFSYAHFFILTVPQNNTTFRFFYNHFYGLSRLLCFSIIHTLQKWILLNKNAILFPLQLLIYWPFYIYTFTNIGQAWIQTTATFALANLEKFC